MNKILCLFCCCFFSFPGLLEYKIKTDLVGKTVNATYYTYNTDFPFKKGEKLDLKILYCDEGVVIAKIDAEAC